jgi:NAD(P)-dependent dehydrogenase (short-subunit alcohol dehydrogenase family)
VTGWLDGHVSLIVGGGSGIGRATAEAFLSEGASLVILEHDAEKCLALEGLGDQVIVVHGDARSLEDNRRAVAEAEAAFGRIDSAMTFVGVFDHYARLADIPDERLAPAFDEVFSTNVLSALNLAQAAAPQLRRDRGSLVLTLSTSSFYPGRGGILYVASKFALRGVVTQLAHELAPDVRVNGVAPGGTLDTDMRGPKALDEHERRLSDHEGRAEGMRARTPLQVALNGADHAGAYIYLVSDRARALTGVVINSDGGIGVRG